MKKLMDMSVEELKAYKKTIIEKIETHLPELCNDIDEVIAIKKEAEDNWDGSNYPATNPLGEDV
tara:strand:+ start:390 stop:581 length:192 start_codon:yes stop_codon:yes gene_type:complete